MTDYQEALLAKHKFTKQEDEELLVYAKSVTHGSVTVSTTIEVTDSPDPDLMVYKGLVELSDGKRLGDWDTGRRYRLLDVIIDCDKIEALVKTVKKALDKENKAV